MIVSAIEREEGLSHLLIMELKLVFKAYQDPEWEAKTIPYRGILLREKTFVNWQKIRLAEKTFTKRCHVPQFVEKTFVNSYKTSNFAKIFSLESFPLYSITQNKSSRSRDQQSWHTLVILIYVEINTAECHKRLFPYVLMHVHTPSTIHHSMPVQWLSSNIDIFKYMYFFNAGCNGTDLSNESGTTNTARCADRGFVNSLSISDGVVCYNGTTMGSMAVYICNDGFLLVGNEARVCQSDGNWNGRAPQCFPGEQRTYVCSPLSIHMKIHTYHDLYNQLFSLLQSEFTFVNQLCGYLTKFVVICIDSYQILSKLPPNRPS